MLKHKHPEFPSDIFLTLLAVDAQLTLIDADRTDTTQVDLETFLRTDMSKRLITSVILPPMAQGMQVNKVEGVFVDEGFLEIKDKSKGKILKGLLSDEKASYYVIYIRLMHVLNLLIILKCVYIYSICG